MNTATLYIYVKGLTDLFEDEFHPWVNKELKSETLVNIVRVHAMGAAAAGLGVSWLPGAGSIISLAANVGFIWSMYFRINKAIGLKISKSILKTLAAAVLSNLAQSVISLIGTFTIGSLVSLIPGVGNVLSSIVTAAMDYAVVVVGGIIYLKLLTNLLADGKNPAEMSVKELKAAVAQVISEEDVDTMLKEARDEYKEARKNGTVTGKETIDLESDQEMEINTEKEILTEATA